MADLDSPEIGRTLTASERYAVTLRICARRLVGDWLEIGNLPALTPTEFEDLRDTVAGLAMDAFTRSNRYDRDNDVDSTDILESVAENEGWF